MNEVVSFTCLAELRKLCVVVTSGDIATFSIDEDVPGFEVQVYSCHFV